MSDRGRLSQEEAAAVLAGATPIDRARGASSLRVSGFAARGPDGALVAVTPSSSHRQLLVFVSETCEGCRELVDAALTPALFGLGEGDELVLLLRGEVTSSAVISEAARRRCLTSTEAFSIYEVTSPPFFVLLDPRWTTVATEGVAWGVDAVRSAVLAAMRGEPRVEMTRLRTDEP